MKSHRSFLVASMVVLLAASLGGILALVEIRNENALQIDELKKELASTKEVLAAKNFMLEKIVVLGLQVQPLRMTEWVNNTASAQDIKFLSWQYEHMLNDYTDTTDDWRKRETMATQFVDEWNAKFQEKVRTN